MSASSSAADPYRRVRSFSKARIVIQSRSPRSWFLSLSGCVRRAWATAVACPPKVSSFVLGRAGSFSRSVRTMDSNPPRRSSPGSKGKAPTKSS